MQEIDHRVAAVWLARIAGGKVHEYLSLGRVALQVTLQRASMNLDLFDGAGLLYATSLRGQTRVQAYPGAYTGTCPQQQKRF
jgi:hypothetical protein